MKVHTALFLLVPCLPSPAPAAAAGTEPTPSFVQATILGSNPAKATRTFLDASGRKSVGREIGEPPPALSIVRPGDQAILSLSTDGGDSLITKVRVHRVEAPAAVSAA